ncbi:hypothetical protein [Pedobacter mucosus]|uniref:hypothetical protein n=1 Tax=Pedobacter mucosus TaxID=2895286 RepID=UPI001EE3E906|nr:hypothetical protein [Pedobacter mucosus]UKT62987.1 hypothetical protein LOK61_14570 [Pedobacter mucosus]
MRLGKIIFLDETEARGIIEDENEQEIPFLLDNSEERLSMADHVYFEITLAKYGLTAINIRLNTTY